MDSEFQENNNDIIHLSGMYENWFLDYASYVILERAVPSVEDGFKPVQSKTLKAKVEVLIGCPDSAPAGFEEVSERGL